MKEIGSFYLYDKQLKCDYLILTNRKKRFDIKVENGDLVFIENGEFDNDLPYEFKNALNQIYNLEKTNKLFEIASINIMELTTEKLGLPFIKLKTPLNFLKIDETHLPDYNAYKIYYDETNGELGDYELAFSWNIGDSYTSVYRLYELK